MKKILIALIIILLLTPLTFGYDSFWKDKLDKQSFLLRGSNVEQTIFRVTEWIFYNTEYKFYKYPLPIQDFWEHKVGDCTDMNGLAQYMLKYNRVKTVRVHGFADCYGAVNVKHDWLEYNGTIVDVLQCTNYVKRGERFW